MGNKCNTENTLVCRFLSTLFWFWGWESERRPALSRLWMVVWWLALLDCDWLVRECFWWL